MNDAERWADLRREHAAETIGAHWYAEIQRAVDLTTIRYDPAIYGSSANWNDAKPDLVQQVVVDQLLGRNQLQHIVDEATDLRHARALLSLNVRRVLARRRQRTILDRLLPRVRQILNDRHTPVPGSDPPAWQPKLGDAELRSATDGELAAAASIVAHLPRLAIRRSERASAVYSTEQLVDVVDAVLGHVPSTVTIRDFDHIFRLVLTDLIPTRLVLDGVDAARPDTAEPDVIVTDVADSLMRDLGPDARELISMKILNLSDDDIAERVGLSRPTVAKRKHAILAKLARHLGDLDPADQVRVIEQLRQRIDMDATQ